MNLLLEQRNIFQKLTLSFGIHLIQHTNHLREMRATTSSTMHQNILIKGKKLELLVLLHREIRKTNGEHRCVIPLLSKIHTGACIKKNTNRQISFFFKAPDKEIIGPRENAPINAAVIIAKGVRLVILKNKTLTGGNRFPH